jgi:hypothetical protein
MSDLHTTKQLISGFYELEAGAWRWTGKEFKVQLKTPSKDKATLVLQGTVQPDLLRNGAPLTINASIDGTPLAPQTLTKAGPFVYRVPVPASALGPEIVLADFTLDKTFRVAGDERDLGLIATVISLRAE